MTKQPVEQYFTRQFSNDQVGYTQAIYWFSNLKPSTIDDSLWTPCITAFGEAFENTVYHSKTSTAETIPTKVEIVLTDAMIQIKIWDSGPGFNLEQYVENLPKSVSLHAERGRGLWIISKIADYMNYSRTPNQLNCLTIRKKWPSANELCTVLC